MRRNKQRNSGGFLKEKHEDGFACLGNDEGGHDEIRLLSIHVAGVDDDDH